MPEIIRLECFSCGAPLSVDSRSLDKGYICPHCGSKNYKPLSFEDYMGLMKESFESFDYSIHVKMGELQDEIDKALAQGDEKKAFEEKRKLIVWQIKAAPFFYKTDKQKSQAYDQILYQWQREFLDPKGKELKRKYQEAEKKKNIKGFAKAMYEFQIYISQGMPHITDNFSPEDSAYRTTKYSLNRFDGMTEERKEEIMASIGFIKETTRARKLYCTNCGAELPPPHPGSSVTVCPYCKSEVMVGTGLEGLSSLTKGVTKVTFGGEELSQDIKEKLKEIKIDDTVSGMNFSVIFKSCPNCGQTVQVKSIDAEVESCPHCGYSHKKKE